MYLRSSGEMWGSAWPRTSRQVEPSPAHTPQLSSLALLPSCLSQPTSCNKWQSNHSEKGKMGQKGHRMAVELQITLQIRLIIHYSILKWTFSWFMPRAETLFWVKVISDMSAGPQPTIHASSITETDYKMNALRSWPVHGSKLQCLSST